MGAGYSLEGLHGAVAARNIDDVRHEIHSARIAMASEADLSEHLNQKCSLGAEPPLTAIARAFQDHPTFYELHDLLLVNGAISGDIDVEDEKEWEFDLGCKPAPASEEGQQEGQ